MPIAKGDERHMQHRYCIHCTALLPQEVEACSQCGGRQESQVPYHHLLPGTVLNGRYWVGAALGEGGFGITYIGRDLTLDRRIAIKEYFPSGFATRHNKDNSQVEEITRSSENIYRQGLERFLREAQLLAQFLYPFGHNSFLLSELVCFTLKYSRSVIPVRSAAPRECQWACRCSSRRPRRSPGR